jgi:parvulin-like peptidyl-prolyl isomerase
MKKLAFKRRTKKSVQEESPTRITNETVAEHRERILAGGRRFKYPMQYARHKLVFNAILITAATLVLLVTLGWHQLYVAQNTGTFFYRVTRVVPMPVATVDGQWVEYSDYLMYYRGSVHYLEHGERINLTGKDGKRQADYNKRKALNGAELDAYARKLANELNISISAAQIDNEISEARNTSNGRISQETYDASTMSVLGWSPEENRRVVRNNLTRLAVAYAVDDKAKEQADKAAELAKATDADFAKIAEQLGGDGSTKVQAGVSGLVPFTNRDGGLSTAAAKLQKGQVSGFIKTTKVDGYYIVKLLDKTDTQLSYAYLRIPLSVFDAQFASLGAQGKVKEYINVPAIEGQAAQPKQ